MTLQISEVFSSVAVSQALLFYFKYNNKNNISFFLHDCMSYSIAKAFRQNYNLIY